ncbi:helix-turn-helix transcriptional regulator [uncultured Duncaniella sp.]|uniref:helix-turn-helix domain-containing protein n=1 Tax=uncultured Duncaniella sp. TaxID=2768039 RepID=UPI0025AA1502|nr:helix-turn-helix transcriptional regulator [uncultured Duncaniella sp.]
MAKTDFQNDVVNRIRQLRIAQNVSQIGLANIIDVSNGQIGNIESPKFQHKYTLKHLDLIAKYFGVSITYLLTGDKKEIDIDNLIKYLIKYDE